MALRRPTGSGLRPCSNQAADEKGWNDKRRIIKRVEQCIQYKVRNARWEEVKFARNFNENREIHFNKAQPVTD